MFLLSRQSGFTLVEMIVVVSIISILASIVYANFGGARAAARDDIRQSDLTSLKLAIELYKAQNGRYPSQGCGTVGTQWAGHAPNSGGVTWAASCQNYISGLTPDFVASLPIDPFYKSTDTIGYYYRTNSTGSEYKLIANGSVEVKTITSYENEFARCPQVAGTGACTSATPQPRIYAVYSAGAADW